MKAKKQQQKEICSTLTVVSEKIKSGNKKISKTHRFIELEHSTNVLEENENKLTMKS